MGRCPVSGAKVVKPEGFIVSPLLMNIVKVTTLVAVVVAVATVAATTVIFSVVINIPVDALMWPSPILSGHL